MTEPAALLSPVQPPQARDYRHLLLLSALWGSAFAAIKVALEHGATPLAIAGARIALGAALLLAVARWKRQAWPRGAALWGRLLLLGILGNSLPFTLIAWGERLVSSQLAGILMATIPLMVVILAHVATPDEKLSTGRVAGVFCGLLGVAVLIGVDALAGLGHELLGQGAILLACLSYALYGVGTRRLPPLGAEMAIGVILLLGFAALLPFWLILDPPWTLRLEPPALLAILWLGLAATGCGNLLFFTILRRAGAGFPANNNYLVPVFALFYGFLLFGERPGWNALLALLLIMAGLALPRLMPARR